MLAPMRILEGFSARALCIAAVLSVLGGCGSRANGASPAPPAFDAARAWALLERQVALGPRPAGSQKGQATRDLIADELASYGLEPVREAFEAKTPIGLLKLENVYADVEAPARAGAPAPLIVLCTHFDTKRMSFEFLGANDAGSGTAVLLELARILAREPRRASLRFLFLDGEEAVRPQWLDPDNRYGSRHHVAGLASSGAAERVKACVLLDMVGDRDLQLFTELNSSRELLELVFAAAKAAGLGQHVGGPREAVSDDHLSFLAAGVPSVDLIDFDYGPNNRFWHTPDDALENCSQESLDAAGRIVLAALPALEDWALAR
jgi:hypothetical protein